MKSRNVKRKEAEERNRRYQALPLKEKVRRNSRKVWRKLGMTEDEADDLVTSYDPSKTARAIVKRLLAEASKQAAPPPGSEDES